ncbi:HAMP domain-containing protein [Candidatus Poribacteria bacterium]|nr:HAMP domain-containing protein [Candidatus Poribacteria bacterium]
MRKYSIQNKIVVPFTLLFVMVMVVSTFITITLFNKKYDEKITQETVQWLEVIFKTGYQFEIDKVKKTFGVEIVMFSQDNGVLSTTLEVGYSDEMTKSVKLQEAREILAKSGHKPIIMDITFRGEPYKVIHYPLDMYDRIYTLMRGMSEIAAAKREVTWTMILVAVSGILLVALVGHFIAKNITAPVKDLVSITQNVAGGNLENNPLTPFGKGELEGKITTRDEIGELTAAFNQMTQKLRQSQQELVEAERLATAGRMAAAFAHDIRNPLSAIKMMVQLLRKRVQPGEENQKYILSIIEEIDRLNAIVKSMMDFARPMELKRQMGNVNSALLEVLNLMEAKLNHHKITLVKRFSTDIPLIMLDADKLKQVFMNVILNAIQSMPNGGELTIATKLFEQRTSDFRLLVEISDTGVGIPPENLSRLFEPFFTTKTEGTGLGLTNTKRIIQQHGGDIEVQSKVGEGTRVIMSWPF